MLLSPVAYIGVGCNLLHALYDASMRQQTLPSPVEVSGCTQDLHSLMRPSHPRHFSPGSRICVQELGSRRWYNLTTAGVIDGAIARPRGRILPALHAAMHAELTGLTRVYNTLFACVLSWRG